MPSTLRQGLLALFNIRPGEGRMVALVLLYAILLYTVNVLTRTASYALFLAEFGAANLPYAFVGVAVFASLASFAYLKLNERFSLTIVLIGAHGFLLLSLAAYWLGLYASAPWLVFSLPIYFGVNNTLTIASFWNLLGRLYSLQQGKRLFGLLGAGENVATIAAGFVAPLLVAWLGTPNLFLVATIVMIATLGLLIYLVRANAAHMAEPAEETSPGGEQRAAQGLLGDRYIRLIASVFVLFMIGIYFVDNIFYSLAEIQYPSQDALASFIGLFFGVYGVLSLSMQLFVAGRVLNRFGIQPIILATPIGLLIIMLLFALTGTLTGWQIALFWLVVAAGMYRQVLDAVDATATNVLYQPLPDRQRTQAQTLVNGIVYPLSIGFAGLLLLLLIKVLHFGPVQLAYVVLPVIAAWLALGVLLGRAYPRRLQQALSRRGFSGMTSARPDRSSLDIFRQGLASPQVGEVLYTLDVLTEIAPETLVDGMSDLLSHPERQVRLAALRRVEQLHLKSAIPLIQSRLTAEGSRPVQAASLRTLAALGDQAVFDQVYPYLEHPDMALRQGVVVGLLRSGELEGILLAGEKLLSWVRSPRPADRKFAAEALGEGGIAGFYRPLLSLLEDEQPAVQRAALAAAGKLKHSNLWPAVTACLESHQVRSAAVPALVAGGEAGLPALEHAFAQPGQSRDVATRLARICGRIGGPQAAALLRRHLDWPDVQVRTQILAALNQCGYRAGESDQAYVQSALKAEVAQAAWTLAGLADLTAGNGADPQVENAMRLLRSALEQALARQRERIFLWLALIYDPQAIGQVRDTLAAAARGDVLVSAQQRDYALEVLEVLLPADQRAMLRPLIEALPPADRLRRLSPLFAQPSLGGQARLAEIIRAPAAWLEPWAKACALEAVGQSANGDLADAIIAALSDSDALVREAAVWTLARLDVALYRSHAGSLAEDSSPAVARAVRLLAADADGGKAMLTLVEKVMLLRTVDFLAEADEEVLADAAAMLVELEFKSGDTIVAKDERSSAMYLVIEGQVGMINGDRASTTFRERESFGELALLNPSPQDVAVAALTDARLLRLDQAPLFELIEDHPSVAQGIIQRLAQRLQRAGQGRAETARADLLGGLKEKLGRRL
jgi:ATP/ADP translocase